MAETLYFIRHGQTEWNAERRMQGQWDSDLTELGRAQASKTASAVNALGVDSIYASPLRRTRDTAQPLADATGLPVAFDERLKEWRAGDWSGFLYDEIPARWPEAWEAWNEDRWNYRPPNAENFADLTERGGAFLKEIIAAPEQRVAIVSHGFITRAMVALLLKLPPAEALSMQTPNDAFFRLHREADGWRAERHDAGAAAPGHAAGPAPTGLA